MHTVAVAVVEESGIPLWELYELSIACTVFGIRHADLADPWYDLRLCGMKKAAPAPGFSVSTPHGLDALAGADTVIVPSVPEACAEGGEDVPAELVEALRAAADSGARMVSLCTGAFALAAAGLLDGRRATAHWQHTAALAARHPEVLVDDSVLYTDDGNVLTSAGATAALDLCLHLVRCDLGAQVANQLARRLVVPAHRTGGQAQFIDQPVPQTDDDSLGPALQWATSRLHEPLTVEDMARRARMSPRTFYRRLQQSTGTTPLQWLLARRLSRAQSLLETTALPIDRVSEECGLGTAANLRRHFTQHIGVSPSDYRRNFAGHRTGGHRTAGERELLVSRAP
ncbi:AraC family transcriptional regulator [Streptomyces agglomeratus]|uniref:AraC family transcriptional regulator n=1 Tax=Streptomyces agglomeratus TaxID=285458 RepID=A0A1E5PIV9_9ACTN|nr:helix-turn-helix domain-containing protein [Streptomyces agglomeratus]OEJ29457.1 AraC family transcriptional regulator [Streptomyces agglomeratus]OEJ42525.1 AraC family transcriptional regulator [Streptomyces agglomeratus]OEJ48963.1 AraC family transcriptional regulator [Streptomyces agglomeratus]OEJ52889.1 AraC family transcriptional regulator [Streptomyces agglomeratus]OEJ60226.1 AraC family transcriptional regulator [Streptomyces agglomeratus]